MTVVRMAAKVIGPLVFLRRRVAASSRLAAAGEDAGRQRPGTFDPRSPGRPQDEVDAERCAVKGELLLRAGRSDAAQLFLRHAPQLAPTRRAASALTLRCASQDFLFQRLISAGDRARDAKKWAEAADLYAEALQAYPEHHGYLVQYAHCLKEQAHFAEAECHYRSALALGAPPADVDEHLAFVVLRQEEAETEAEAETSDKGEQRRRRRMAVREQPEEPVASGDVTPFDAPPTKADVDLLVALLLGRRPRIEETVQLLRQHRSVRSLFIELVDRDAFAAVNLRLLSRARPSTG